MERKEKIKKLEQRIKIQTDYKVKKNLTNIINIIQKEKNFVKFSERNKETITKTVGILMDDEIICEYFLELKSGIMYIF